MDINEVRSNSYYEYERYSYIRYFRKRDIVRHISFETYGEFINECKKFSRDKLSDIEIQHEICVKGKLFKLSGALPSTTINQLSDEDNIFDINFDLDMYSDDNKCTVEKYIIKMLLSDFLSSI